MRHGVWKRRLSRRVALGLCLAAVAAPSAQASFPDYGSSSPQAPAAKPIVVHSFGFDWADAGIGARAVVGLGLAASGLRLVRRRKRMGRLVTN